MVETNTQAQPLESYVAAVTVALSEMANTMVVVRNVSLATLNQPWGDFSAVVELKSANIGLLVLTFPQQTAAALAKRVLGDAKVELNEGLICDCVGEIANVIAGQAKTLLAGTPHQMTFSLPKLVAGSQPEIQLDSAGNCSMIAFDSDAGEFFLGLTSNR